MRTFRSSITFTIAALFFGIILSTSTQAQLCTGSLGDAVVNITFGTGTGPGPALPGSIDGYNFVSRDCPDDGNYTIINSTSSCFGNSWHSLQQDHTPGDIDGRMMLVNASVGAGVFYIDTVRGLCANTTYEFSAWVVNVLLPTACSPDPKHPKLIFTIETPAGVLLGKYSTGDIFETSSPQWKQYGLFFTTPINTNDVVIRIKNEAAGGCGNDLALDDITFRPCGPTVQAGVATAMSTEQDLCAASLSATTLSATIGSGYNGPSQQWQESLDNGFSWKDIPGAITTNYVFNKTAIGKYQYRLTVAEGTNIVLSNCRVASNIVTITIHDVPAVTATGNSPVCENTNLALDASGGATFSWTGPAGFTSSQQSPSFNAQANAAGQYNVVITDQFGCVNTASTNAAIIPKPTAVVSANKSICEGSNTVLSASGGDDFLWSPATGLSGVDVPAPTATPSETTVYTVAVTNSNACTDTASVKISVLKKPTASAGEDRVIIKGESVILNGTVGGSEISYTWSPAAFLNDASLMQPLTNTPHDTTYILNVISNAGCGSATDNVFVKVFNDIYIPTAFSPNDDGNNDIWRIEALVAFPKAVLTVFNRYGNKVFEGNGGNSFWDGKCKGEVQPAGTYIYMINFKDRRPIKKGWVMIVR